MPADFTGQYQSRAQNINLGSYAKVAPGSALDGVDQLTFAATIWPTRLMKPDQGVLCRFNSETGNGVALLVGPEGVEALVGQVDAEPLRVSTGTPLLERNWYRIWVSVNCEIQNRQRRSVRAEQAGYREGNGKCQARRSFGVRYRCANHDRRHRGQTGQGPLQRQDRGAQGL